MPGNKPAIPAPPVHCPIKSIYDIEPCDPEEIAPLVAHLRADEQVNEARTFPRGTVLTDGRLDLCKQSLGPGGCRLVTDALARNTRIKSLLLGTDGIGDGGAANVADLIGRNEHLEIVYLGCNRISSEGIGRLCDALTGNTTVTGLWLKRNPIGPDGARHVARMLRHNRTLRILDLVNTDIGEEGLAVVLDVLVTENRTLERLYLGGNAIGPDGAARLAELLRCNPVLKALLVPVNPLGDRGTHALAVALETNTTLHDLGMASVGIGTSGGGALASVLAHHPALTSLDLGYSPSTRVLGGSANALSGAMDAIAAYLAGNPPLRRLDLTRSGIDGVGRTRIADALEANGNLLDLFLEGEADERIENLLLRNRAAVAHADTLRAPEPGISLIRSVYRTLAGRPQ